MHDSLSPKPIVDGELLRAFAAFAEHLSFTHAARRIGLSQPALHDRVGRLSEQLGVALYTRRGRTIALTDAGVRVAAFARETLERADRFTDALQGRALERVVLAAGAGSYLYLLGPAIQRFVREAPGALDARTLGGPSAAAAARSGAAHLAFGVYDVVPRDLAAQDVITTPLCAALRADHPLAARETVPLAALADGGGAGRLILAPPGQKHRDLIARAVAGIGGAVTDPVTADGWPLMLAFAAAGLGVGVVNGTCRPPPGCVLRPVPELGEVTYRLLWRRGADLSPAAERLAALIAGLGEEA